jgi:hypothetical protein
MARHVVRKAAFAVEVAGRPTHARIAEAHSSLNKVVKITRT